MESHKRSTSMDESVEIDLTKPVEVNIEQLPLINSTQNNKHESTENSINKYSPTSTQGIIIVIIGTILYGIFGIFIRLSYLDEKSAPYDMDSVLVCSEAFKFFVSLILFRSEKGSVLCVAALYTQTLKEWLTFSIPALIYTITNSLDFYIRELELMYVVQRW